MERMQELEWVILGEMDLWTDLQYYSQRQEFENGEGSSRVPEGLAQNYGGTKEQLNTAELSDYYAKRYLAGELYNGSCYSESWEGELPTYKYTALDGIVMVWRHAFDLRKGPCEDVITLYHYTDKLAFRNVGNLEQSAAQLYASFTDERAHFGEGIYVTQHEPAVWGSRLQILLNNYSNKDPFSPTPEEAGKRDDQWGNGRKSGHRAAFCIPLIVPRSIAYNIFERHTPDMAERMVKDSAGQERPIKLGEDYRGEPTHPNRDVWVVRVETDGRVQHATTDADSILDVLQLRLQKLRASTGKDMLMADCMFELARRLHGRARYGEAEKLYRECSRICEAKKGKDHPDTLTLSCLNNLAQLLAAQGQLARAEYLHREALKRKAKLGADRPDTLQSLNNLALLLTDQGQLAEAEDLYQKALKKSPEDHPQTLTCLNNLAGFLQAKGQLEKAKDLYEKVLKKREVQLGEDHPDTLGSLNNLALLLRDQGQLQKAKYRCHEALKKRKAKLGDDHPDTLQSLNNLALILADQGHLAEAEDLYQKALKKSPEDHPQTLTCQNNLAWLLQAKGQLAEAEDLYEKVLKKRKEQLGKDHLDTLAGLNNLAALLKAQGRLAEAEPLFREALEKSRPKLGNQHPTTMILIRNLADLLNSMKKFEEAEKLFREELAARISHHGEHHEETVFSRRNLANFLQERGKVAQAQELRLAGETAQ